MPKLLSLMDHVKERLSSVVLTAGPRALDEKWRQWSRDWRGRELTPIPSGIHPKPVLGDPGRPLLRHTLDYIRFGSDFSREGYERLGSVSWMGAFGTNMVVIAGPDATRDYHVRWDNSSLPVPVDGLSLELRRL